MNHNAPSLSLIVSCYNQEQALAMILAALETQTFKDAEIIIAEDDQSNQVEQMVAAFARTSGYVVKHFRQEHKGFRKCKILNQAIAACRGRVVAFLDGDCVPHSHYLEQHYRLSEKGFYVAGRRIDLSQSLSSELTPEKIKNGFLNGSLDFLWKLFVDSFRKEGSVPFHRSYLVRTKWLRALCGLDSVVDMKGCNFSVLREDLLAVDGYDESYEGYGREDTDLELRFKNLGLKIKSAKNLCLQYHVWHERREFTPVNEVLLEEVQKTKRVKALKGLSYGH